MLYTHLTLKMAGATDVIRSKLSPVFSPLENFAPSVVKEKPHAQTSAKRL